MPKNMFRKMGQSGSLNHFAPLDLNLTKFIANFCILSSFLDLSFFAATLIGADDFWYHTWYHVSLR